MKQKMNATPKGGGSSSFLFILIPRVEKKSMKFEIAPPYFFPPIMGLIKYVSQVQPILNLEPSEEIDHCVKIKSKINFYHFKRHLPHSRGQ